MTSSLAEAGGQRPGPKPAAGIGLAASLPGKLAVERQPARQRRMVGIPGHRGVVGIASRHDAARPAHPAHLAQRGDRIGQVLQHLVGVHDVEAVRVEVQGVRRRPAAA